MSVNGKPFTALQKGKDANKPYLYPLFTASGKRVVRGGPTEQIAGEPTDHPHQRGMWLGYEHLSGQNMWEIRSRRSTTALRFDSVSESDRDARTERKAVDSPWRPNGSIRTANPSSTRSSV